jgi:hypothetical protein
MKKILTHFLQFGFSLLIFSSFQCSKKDYRVNITYNFINDSDYKIIFIEDQYKDFNVISKNSVSNSYNVIGSKNIECKDITSRFYNSIGFIIEDVNSKKDTIFNTGNNSVFTISNFNCNKINNNTLEFTHRFTNENLK